MTRKKERIQYTIKPRKLSFKERILFVMGKLTFPPFGIELLHKQAEYKGNKDHVFINFDQMGFADMYDVSKPVVVERWVPEEGK